MNPESRQRIRDALEHRPSPPPWGWTADDMDRLPSDGPNGEPGFFEQLELIDGALIFAAPQSRFHERTLHGLVTEISGQAPDATCAVGRMDVKLGHRTRPCPDVLVIDDAAADDLNRTFYAPDEVHLVVEVVSPESEERDRKLKPPRYAEAGIAHFWRVEENDGRPVVYVRADVERPPRCPGPTARVKTSLPWRRSATSGGRRGARGMW